MSLRNCNKGKTPLDPPLTGGKQEHSVEHSSEEGVLTAPPLFEAGSQQSCGVPNSIPLAGARGGREGFACKELS